MALVKQRLHISGNMPIMKGDLISRDIHILMVVIVIVVLGIMEKKMETV